MTWREDALEWYKQHQEEVDKLLEGASDHTFAPSREDIWSFGIWTPNSWKWFFEKTFPTKANMCGYSDLGGISRGSDSIVFLMTHKVQLAKPKRLRCPACGRRMMSWVRTCHDGCCVFHCIPKHKIKKWWKLDHKKKTSKDKHMRRRN